MNTSSVDSFIHDFNSRMYEDKEWIYNLQNHNLDPEVIFYLIKKRIFDQFSLNKKKLVNEDCITFHPKYGWVISDFEVKSFLGKIFFSCTINFEIGKYSYLSSSSYFYGDNNISIGSFTAIGLNCNVTAFYDRHPFETSTAVDLSDPRFKDCGIFVQNPLKPKINNNSFAVNIGSNVWIGRNVNIRAGVDIANGCVIGENSLVNRNTVPFGVYAGTPAKLIKMRFSSSTIEKLESIGWWNWDNERINKNTHFFSLDLNNYYGNLTDEIF